MWFYSYGACCDISFITCVRCGVEYVEIPRVNRTLGGGGSSVKLILDILAALCLCNTLG